MTVELKEQCFPSGWYRFGSANNIKPAKIYTYYYFNTAIICFRNSQNLLKVFNAYCPHLGANLGVGGKIKNDLIICPFHGWKYDASGQCVDIPYCKTIPKKALLKQYQIKEFNSLIYIFFDDLAASIEASDKPPTIFSQIKFNDLFNLKLVIDDYKRLRDKLNISFISYGPGIFFKEDDLHYHLIASTPIDKKQVSVYFCQAFKKIMNPLHRFIMKKKIEQQMKLILTSL